MGFTASSPALYIFSILSNSCSALLAANMPCLDLAQQSMQELYVTSRRKVSTQQDKIRICNDGIINSHLNLASTFHLLLLILPPNDEEVSLLANLHCCRQCPSRPCMDCSRITKYIRSKHRVTTCILIFHI